MQGWVINKIKTDNPRVISSFMEKSKYGEDFDFNKLIPMPKSLDIEYSTIIAKAIVCYLTNKFQQPLKAKIKKQHKNVLFNFGKKDYEKALKETSGEELDKLYELGKQYMINKEKYGYYTWCDWRNKFWGTKYNAWDTKYSSDLLCEVSFDTEWNAPIPIFEKMCSMFPNAKIEFCCECDWGFILKFINDNGVLKEIEDDE